jgi:hypothetical protein
MGHNIIIWTPPSHKGNLEFVRMGYIINRRHADAGTAVFDTVIDTTSGSWSGRDVSWSMRYVSWSMRYVSWSRRAVSWGRRGSGSSMCTARRGGRRCQSLVGGN